MTPEGKVKAQVKAVLKKYRVWYFMPVSAGYGKHGVPDFICCVHNGGMFGAFLAIECKAEGGKITALQAIQHIGITAAAGIVLVINEHNINTLEQHLRMHATPI